MVAVVLLLAAVVAFRLIPSGWENVSPMAALVLCSAVYLPRKWAAILPLIALLGSDMALNIRYGAPLVNGTSLSVLAAFALVFALGWSQRKRPRIPLVFASAVAGSFLFYLLTNTAAWFASPAYTRDFPGWIQALTVGTPGFPPTWTFFRNSLLGDIFFTGLFIFVLVPRARAGLPAHAPSRPAPAER